MQNSFYGISILDSKNIVSLITEDYFKKIQNSSPPFYAHFCFHPFSSPRSFTELSAELPFCLPLEMDSKKDPLQLNPHEQEHYAIHQRIIAIYREHELTPEPPWVHIENGNCAELLKVSMGELERSLLALG